MKTETQPDSETVLFSFVVLNYRDPTLTETCVDHITRASRSLGFGYEVLIVDNSAEHTGSRWQSGFPAPHTKVICASSNLGFSKANNWGASFACGRYLVALNNDAFVTGEALARAAEVLSVDGTIGIWSPALVGLDGAPQASAGGLPRLADLVSEYLPFRPAPNPISGGHETPIRNVGSVIGACMVVPLRLFRELGGFDERYFFTVEDMDLCFQVQRAHYRVVYDSAVKIVHVGGASQTWKWINDPNLHRNRILYFHKNYGTLQGLASWAIICFGLLLRRIFRLLRTS